MGSKPRVDFPIDWFPIEQLQTYCMSRQHLEVSSKASTQSVLNNAPTCHGPASVHCRTMLAVTDHDFAEEFSRCLAKILRRRRPYKIRWSERKNRWVVQGSGILLYKFLNCDWKSLKKWIEHCDRCRGAFLRAFYDSEGCISDSLVIYNTGKELLSYVKKLLEHLDIETGPLHTRIAAGTTLRDPRNGRSYIRKKDCFSFAVRKRSLPMFAEYVGFTIERKSERLRDAALRVKQQQNPQTSSFSNSPLQLGLKCGTGGI